MAGDPQPFASPTEEYALPDEYEFDPVDDLEPGNDMVDAALTRAGELVLDLIETVQAHPVLTASLLASGMGLLGGLVAARLAPRKRPPTPTQQAAALAEELAAASSERAGLAWSRLNRDGGALLSRAAERGRASFDEAASLTERGRERAWSRLNRDGGALLSRAADGGRSSLHGAALLGRASLDEAEALSERGRKRARFAWPWLRQHGEEAVDVARAGIADMPHPGHDGQGTARKAVALAQLGPLAVALLRNPIVRDVLVHMVMRQVRRAAR